MSAPPRGDRKVIPRWRSFTATLALGELDPLISAKRTASSEDAVIMARRGDDFASNRGAAFASDLVGSALVLGATDQAIEAAELLADGQIPTSAMARRMAELLLRESERGASDPVGSVIEHDHPARLRELRRGLRESPRNALRWADVARLHTIGGRRREASRAMSVALALAPENRYVLRSAVRLRLHEREPEAAHAILQRSARTPHDPWLLAAELTVSDLTERRSRHVRRANEMIDSSRFSHFELTELASTLATIELGTGDHRAARKLFRRALVAPTDNSVAQAEWAAPQLGLDVGEEPLAATTSWEARALAAHRAGDPERSAAEAWQWLDDQPFASRPAEFGSYEASSASDFELGVKFAERGIVANPDEFLLRNNAAFCLLSLNRVEEAESHLTAIRRDTLTPAQRAVFTATLGLYHFRRGDLVAGRDMYHEAIRISREPSVRTLATMMFAREELVAGFPGVEELIARASELAARPESSELKVWLAQIMPASRR